MKKRLHSLISFFIVTIVAVLVFGVAGTIVWINVANSHSNYRVIKNQVVDHHLYEQFQQKVQAAGLSPAHQEQQPEDPDQTQAETVPVASPSSAKAHALTCQEIGKRDGSTLYAYLESSGRSKSFTTRQFLAEKYDIADYKGSSVQNQQLLKALVADDLQTAKCVQ